MGYFFGCGNACNSGGGGSTAGKLATTANIGAIESDNLKPVSDWPTGYGRLDFNINNGNAIVTGLLPGTDGQSIIGRNTSATFELTIPALSSSSSAANQFSGGGGGLILPPLASAQFTYYAGTVNKWVITS